MRMIKSASTTTATRVYPSALWVLFIGCFWWCPSSSSSFLFVEATDFAPRTTTTAIRKSAAAAANAGTRSVGVRSLETTDQIFETYDCFNTGQPIGGGLYEYPNCTLLSNSPIKISTTDEAVDDAHNYAIDVYGFYLQMFNRSSIDDAGMPIRSFVHFGSMDYDIPVTYAFYDSALKRLVYSDGDGDVVNYWSQCSDEVTWLFTEGVSEHTSNLKQTLESGSLKIAFNFIMAAAADRLAFNKSQEFTWRIYEDCYSNGLGDRNLANPGEYKFPNHYTSRRPYDKSDSYWFNAAIVEYAFYLMVQGGAHPVSQISVPALDSDFDTSLKIGARIVYETFTKCLTSSQTSDFISARECSLKVLGTTIYDESITKAWEAVGITPPVFQPLSFSTSSKNLACGGSTSDNLFFRLSEKVPAGTNVTCRLEVPNKSFNPSLLIRFGSRPEGEMGSDCVSNKPAGAPYEQCTAGPAQYEAEVYVTVQSFSSTPSTGLTLTCYSGQGPTCKATSEPCKKATDCCGGASFVCDGTKTKTCKKCKKSGKCARTAECCKGKKCKNKKCV